MMPFSFSLLLLSLLSIVFVLSDLRDDITGASSEVEVTVDVARVSILRRVSIDSFISVFTFVDAGGNAEEEDDDDDEDEDDDDDEDEDEDDGAIVACCLTFGITDESVETLPSGEHISSCNVRISLAKMKNQRPKTPDRGLLNVRTVDRLTSQRYDNKSNVSDPLVSIVRSSSHVSRSFAMISSEGQAYSRSRLSLARYSDWTDVPTSALCCLLDEVLAEAVDSGDINHEPVALFSS